MSHLHKPLAWSKNSECNKTPLSLREWHSARNAANDRFTNCPHYNCSLPALWLPPGSLRAFLWFLACLWAEYISQVCLIFMVSEEWTSPPPPPPPSSRRQRIFQRTQVDCGLYYFSSIFVPCSWQVYNSHIFCRTAMAISLLKNVAWAFFRINGKVSDAHRDLWWSD